MTHASKYIDYDNRAIVALSSTIKKSRVNDLKAGFTTPFNITIDCIKMEYRACWAKLINKMGFRLLFRYEGKEYLIIYNK